MSRFFCLQQLGEVYTQLREDRFKPDYLDLAVKALGVSYSLERGDLGRIPTSGPLIVVANHPFGGLEAILLAHLLRSVRPDAKMLANFLLARIEEAREFCIFVDPFGRPGSAQRNLVPLKEALHWVKSGGALGVFPSGTVSHFHLRKREVSDPEWSPTIARFIRHTQAPVLPVYFHDRNGFWFQLAGMIHPRLRTMLLPREFYNKLGSNLKVSIGSVTTYDRLERFASDEDLLEYLRLRTYILGSGDSVPCPRSRRAELARSLRRINLEPLVPPEEPRVLEREVKGLGKHQLLTMQNQYDVYYARAQQIPHLIREIGRLREYSFRQVEEGTGRALDLDRFDNFYTHLFVWNRDKKEVVGAYRLVKSDYVLSRYGKRGFYTYTLFKYRTTLMQQLGPALELGRSFVRPEYQRDYWPLLLLWRGIGVYVARNPEFKVLFGPVSINSEYDDVSRFLIMMFLRVNNFFPELSRVVKARNPMPRTFIRGVRSESARVVRDLSDVSVLLREIEAKHKTIPVLLRQYLKLGAKLLAFNVDPNFGDVLDGLIYVDLTETEPKMLERYVGKDSAAAVLSYHGKKGGGGSKRTAVG